MRHIAVVSIVSLMAVAPALGVAVAQEKGPPGRVMNNIGILAVTPTRIEASAREMNRGRENQDWGVLRLTPTQIRSAAEDTLIRGGLECTIADVRLTARLMDRTPIMEVVCEEGGGLMIAATEQVQATDCIDLVGSTGALGPCRLPGNVEFVSAARSAATPHRTHSGGLS